jgi:hypothetical protein
MSDFFQYTPGQIDRKVAALGREPTGIAGIMRHSGDMMIGCLTAGDR